jgi:hypothetical protein
MPGGEYRPACAFIQLETSPRSKLKVRNALIVEVARSGRVRSIHGAPVETSRTIISRVSRTVIVSRTVSVVPVERPRSPHISRMGVRRRHNRTKRNSCARGNDQDFTHDMAPFVAPPAKPYLRTRTAFRQWGLQIFNPGRAWAPLAARRMDRRMGREIAHFLWLARRTRVTGARPPSYATASHASCAHQCGGCGRIPGPPRFSSPPLRVCSVGATLVVALSADHVRKRGDHKGRPHQPPLLEALLIPSD